MHQGDVEGLRSSDKTGAAAGSAEMSAESVSLAEDGRQLIVVGSSAGGIDALGVLVRSLPGPLPVPMILAQHLDPRRKSHLAEILSRHTEIPVQIVDDHAALEPGAILVLPPNRHAEIRDHDVVLREGVDGGPRPSIDHILASAASAFGEGLIAVILTGTGSDGAAGARQVKAAGGTVIIQNPETASYPGMPEAIAPNTVDIVADLEAIGPLLNDLATGTYEPSRPDDERLLQVFLDQLRERSGIDFASYKRATILRRLQRRMAATGTTRLREYTRYVQANPEEFQRLTSSFLIKVTEFFRDTDLFAYLQKEVVPRLIAEARDREHELRIWSAGCATGEEAYSLAILVSEALGDELQSFNVRIFATDVDAEAVSFARRGLYPGSALAGTPDDILDRYFNRVGDHFEVRKRIRALTVFGQHDLGQRAPFPRVDLALCRNVLIYFTTELQRRSLQLFAFSLRDGGYLVLGKAESTTPLSDSFVLEQPRLKVYRRQGERVLIPPARIRDSTPLMPQRMAPRRTIWSEPPGIRSTRELLRTPTPSEKAETLLLRLPVGLVLIDRQYDIQTINAAARRLLAIHGPAVHDDFIHQLPESIAGDLRAAVDAAFRGETVTTVHELPLPRLEASESHWVEVISQPVVAEHSIATEQVMILVTDVTTRILELLGLQEQAQALQSERDRVVEQGRVLADANAELTDANQELSTANAELRSTNEELLVANEEVQAATEEVETLNEELQATNEELETLNEELQATVEELNTTNDDLQARSLELQESAFALASQRSQTEMEQKGLQAMIDMLPEAMAAVDQGGGIVLQNEAFRELVGNDGDIVLTSEGIPPSVGDASPASRAGRGESFKIRAQSGDGHLIEIESRPQARDSGITSILVARKVAGKG
jgi:two-component system CheB/CheR fusion protein